MYYGGFGYAEACALPVAYRKFFTERIAREMQQSTEAGSTQSRAAHANTPELRALQGRSRLNVPARLRRF